MAQYVVWVIDTSSVIEIRRSIENLHKDHVFLQMSALVDAGRLVYPKEVVAELQRLADPLSPDRQYRWAKDNERKACARTPSPQQIKDVLADVPRVLDPDKDTGVDEADPYVLALAISFRADGQDTRIVTEETKDTPRKMSLRTAAGLLGLASVPLRAFLHFEKII